MIAILYCPECKKWIEEMGAPVSDLYNIIAENYFVYRLYSYFNPKEDKRKKTILKYMELKGLITTTEIDQKHIGILPKGVRCIGDHPCCLCHVCLKPEEHNRKE